MKLNFGFSILFITSLANASPLAHLMQEHSALNINLDSEDQVKSGYFSQWVDHTNHGIGKFEQHFLIDERYSTSDSDPVFLGFGGEWTLENT